MVVNDLDIFRAFWRPSKAETPLVVDPDAVTPDPIPPQGFESIAGRRGKKLQCRRGFELRELTRRHSRD